MTMAAAAAASPPPAPVVPPCLPRYDNSSAVDPVAIFNYIIVIIMQACWIFPLQLEGQKFNFSLHLTVTGINFAFDHRVTLINYI